MHIFNNKDGQAEIIEEKRKGVFLVKFLNTGSLVLATTRKIKNGSVKDPLAPGKARWEMKKSDGTTYTARFLDEFCEHTGLTVAMLQKIATKDRFNDSIIYINKI